MVEHEIDTGNARPFKQLLRSVLKAFADEDHLYTILK